MSNAEILVLCGLATVVMLVLWRALRVRPGHPPEPTAPPELRPDDLREAMDDVELALYLLDEASSRLRPKVESARR